MSRSNFFTDNGPNYQCPLCGADISGEIGHECNEEGVELRIIPMQDLEPA